MKIVLLITSLLISATAYAGGFTFFALIEQQVGVKQHVITFLFCSILFVVCGVYYRLKLNQTQQSIIPDAKFTFRNAYEFLGQFIYNLTKGIMGEKDAKKFFPVIILVFTFIFLNNVAGLIPGFLPPTDNFNTTLALGFFVFLYYNYEGIRAQGLVGHIKHFMGPVWYLSFLILPIEIVSHIVRPISLGLRLKGNMEGDHLVLSIFSGLVPYLVPIPFYIIGLFVCFMQAFVFTTLTIVYINLSTAHHDHAEHEHH